MYRFLAVVVLGIVASCSLAWAGDLDENTVIRDEHVNPVQDSDSNNHRDRSSSRDVLTAENSQDIISARVLAMESGAGPMELELDSLGLYFGLGEHFIDMANGVIDSRESSYMEHGSFPVFSRLSDTDFSEISSGGGSHRYGSSDDDSDEESEGLNRRGANHDYFYD